MRQWTRKAAVGAALAFGIALGGGGRADIPRSNEEMVVLRVEGDELTRYLVKAIEDDLKPTDVSPQVRNRVRSAALLLASHAQSGNATRDPWQRIALRDNALRVLRALSQDDLETAQKHAPNLLDVSASPVRAARVDLSKEMDLDEAEGIMKQRPRGGLGFDSKPGAPRDSIELRLIQIGRVGIKDGELKAQADDLTRAALVISAQSVMLDVYTPDKKVGNKDPKDWQKYTSEMREGAKDLRDAAKHQEPAAVKKAALRVQNSCIECHTIFRD
jgi:Cytochrome C'